MKRIFTTNLIFLLLLNGLVKPFWIFAIDRNVQNVLGAREYGFYFVLFNFTLIFNILLDFGVTNFNNREISRHPQLIGKYFSGIFRVKFFLGGIYALVVTGAALLLGYFREHTGILLLLMLNQFLASFILYIRSNLNALHFFRIDSILSVFDKLIMIVSVGFFLWSPLRQLFSIREFILCQTAAYFLTGSIALSILVRHTGRLLAPFDAKLSYSMLRSSLPYALLVLLMSVYGRIDTIVVERVLPDGFRQAGIYAQAFRLLDTVNMFPYLVASLLLPIFSRMLKKGAEIRPMFDYAQNILFVAAISIAVPTIVFRSELMDLLYVEHTGVSSTLLGILMGSFVFIALSYGSGTLLTAKGDVKKLNAISGGAVAVSLFSQWMLLTHYGIIGSAIGNFLVNALVLAAQLALLHRWLHFTFTLSVVVRKLLFLLCSIAIALLLQQIAVSAVALWGGAVVLSAISALLLGVIRLKTRFPFTFSLQNRA